MIITHYKEIMHLFECNEKLEKIISPLRETVLELELSLKPPQVWELYEEDDKGVGRGKKIIKKKLEDAKSLLNTLEKQYRKNMFKTEQLYKDTEERYDSDEEELRHESKRLRDYSNTAFHC